MRCALTGPDLPVGPGSGSTIADDVTRRGERPLDGVTVPSLLYVLFLLYIFIGVSPLSETDASTRVDGSIFDRIAALSLAALAAGVIALRFRTALRLVRRTWLVWCLVGWITASTLWSDYPDLTLRRAVSTDLVAIVCLALATSLPDPRRIHLLTFAVLTIVVTINIATIVLLPGFAISEFGVRGIYLEKNHAGLVGMVAAVVASTWTLQARRPWAIVLGAGATMMAIAFLVVTQSKTSIALTFLAALELPAIMTLCRLGPARAGTVTTVGLAVAVVAALFFSGLGGNWIALASGGDESFTGRSQIWDFSIHEIARRPWLGVGYGAFWDVGLGNDPLLRAPPGEWVAQVKIGVINQAHDGFLDLLLQGGIPLLVLALAIWGQTAIRLVRLVSSSKRDNVRIAFAMNLILMSIILLHNVTETSLWARGQTLGDVNILISLLAAAALARPPITRR